MGWGDFPTSILWAFKSQKENIFPKSQSAVEEHQLFRSVHVLLHHSIQGSMKLQARFYYSPDSVVGSVQSLGNTSFSLIELPYNEYFCFIDYAKAFDCVYHNKLWKYLKEMGVPDHLTCLLRNLYSGQEATVRTRHGKKDGFQIKKGVHQGCIFSPCFFNLCAENIMRNARMDEARAGLKIARRNINNFRYAHDTTVMAESEEELKSLLMKDWKRVKKLA